MLLRRALIAGLCLAVLWLCLNMPTVSDTVVVDADSPAAPTDRESCLAAEGVWEASVIGGGYSCNMRTGDGGKPCFDSSECESLCIADLSEVDLGAARAGREIIANGTCSSWRINLDCNAVVSFGRVKGIICSD
jgi:hypothetical protein